MVLSLAVSAWHSRGVQYLLMFHGVVVMSHSLHNKPLNTGPCCQTEQVSYCPFTCLSKRERCGCQIGLSVLPSACPVSTSCCCCLTGCVCACVLQQHDSHMVDGLLLKLYGLLGQRGR